MPCLPPPAGRPRPQHPRPQAAVSVSPLARRASGGEDTHICISSLASVALACWDPACTSLHLLLTSQQPFKHASTLQTCLLLTLLASGRDLFKLPKIELRCQVAPDHFVPVEPRVQLPNLLVQHPPTHPPTTRTSAMEVDTRPLPAMVGPRHMHYDQHHDQHHHHRSFEATRQSLPPPQTARSPPAPLPLHAPLQKSPSNPPLATSSPAVKPIHDVHYVPPPRQSPREPSHHAHRPSSSTPQSHPHSPVDQRVNGQPYPRPPQEVQLDAIERLQTQMSQNSSALVAQSRDMRRYEETLQHEGENLRREFTAHFHQQNAELGRVDEAVGRLQREMLGIRELLEGLTREVHVTRELQARAGVPVPGHPMTGQDSALELMAQQMAVMTHKTNEVDTLKITIEIMKNKIQRLEDAATTTLQAQAPPSQYASPREVPVRPVQPPHPPQRAMPNQAPQIDIPVPTQRTQSYHSQGSQSVAVTPDGAQRPEPLQTQSGWVTVNAGAKRTHTNGTDSPHDSVAPSIGSPGKRPKLAPESQAQRSYSYDHMDTDDSDAAHMQTHRHTLPPQNISVGPASQSTLASQHHFIPYGTQDAPSDDSWRPESQRIPTEARTPRGRGRGGGPGSRGGRVRKSMAAQYAHPISTPEWERDEWHGVPESQISPDGFYNSARAGRGIIRRGSGGGGGRGGRPGSSGRSVSLGLQGVTAGAGIGFPVDPYAHTKKTRTKPIRNADGVLIRKDGRPDMRSQSSAANLRKVHARKEDEEHPNSEQSFTPTPSNLHHSTSVGGTETPSPTRREQSGQDLTSSQKKHTQVMSKIFPSGVEEVSKDHDYARKLFEEDQDHTAQPRTAQHHHHHRHAQESQGRASDVKREHAEDRVAETQSPNDEDVDMDHPDDHADDEAQTPSGQSDNSERDSQYHDATEQDSRAQYAETQDESAQAPNSTIESSQTAAASSHAASVGSHLPQPTGSTPA